MLVHNQAHLLRQLHLTSADPEALVYELVIPGRGNLFLQKVDDNLLLFLDQQKNLMVGNLDFSYVLSRAEPKKVLTLFAVALLILTRLKAGKVNSV